MAVMKLVDAETGADIYCFGDTAQRKTFRGEAVVVESVEPPRHPGSTGRVYCRDANGVLCPGWYPSVIGAKFVEMGS
jgi:hypothetical protein